MTVKTYPVLVNWLPENIRGYEPVLPEVTVVHSTANPGVGDEAHAKYWSGAKRPGWTTYVLDWDSIRQVVPEGVMAPGQGPTYNRKAISTEMCEPPQNVPYVEQLRMFNETWKRMVWLQADICFRYGWDESEVISHLDISQELPNETDHTDPHAFFARYGKKWSDLITDVVSTLRQMRGDLPTPALWQTAFVDQLLASKLITDRRHPMQSLTWWEAGALFSRTLDRMGDLEKRVAALEAKGAK